MDLSFNNLNYSRKDINITIFGIDMTKFITAINTTVTNSTETLNNLNNQPAHFANGSPVREGSISMVDAGVRELNRIAIKKGYSNYTELVGYNLEGIENNIVIQAYTNTKNVVDTYTLSGVTFNSFEFGFDSNTAIYSREIPFGYMELVIGLGD